MRRWAKPQALFISINKITIRTFEKTLEKQTQSRSIYCIINKITTEIYRIFSNFEHGWVYYFSKNEPELCYYIAIEV